MLKRTADCNELRKENIGDKVILSGWVASWRDHGGIVFIDIRDINGITQIVFGREKGDIPKEKSDELNKMARKLRNEYVIAIKGEVVERLEGTRNEKISTGEIEIIVTELEILNSCKELPFDFKKMDEVGEEIRLKYRYLEMRTGKLKDNLIFKHKFYQLTRNFFSDNEFYEIETPFLTKATPEGARDYLVPSRLSPGKFYALPQSPQLFKQILMVGGFMRYFQIVKCFRDEDLRHDRQPEFSQVDLEMSFVDENDVKNILEEYIVTIFKKLLDVEIKRPFKMLPYHESMLKYGTDKPDLRIPYEIIDITELAGTCSFKVFNNAAEKGVVRGLKIPDADKISLSVIEKVTKEIQPFGARGLAWMRHKEEGLQSQITKFFTKDELGKIANIFSTKKDDILFFIADSDNVVSKALGYLRTRFFEPDKKQIKLLWVEEYPLFEKDTETGGWASVHHPFTSPDQVNIESLEKDPGAVMSKAYDLVLNGSEIGGGSIRIHSQDLQKKVFNILGMEEEEAQEKFGFLLNALAYGAPPHGGFAFGVDRLIMMMLNLKSIRDVIPFPKTQKAFSPLTDAPSTVSEKQLEELSIKIDKIK